MKPTMRRLIRINGWSLIAMAILIVALTVASRRFGFFAFCRVSGRATMVAVERGRIFVNVSFANAADANRPRFNFEGERLSTGAALQWWPPVHFDITTGWLFRGYNVEVKGWVLCVVAAGAGVVLVRLTRARRDSQSCAKCGYSLVGISPDSPCPECGARSPGAASD